MRWFALSGALVSACGVGSAVSNGDWAFAFLAAFGCWLWCTDVMKPKTLDSKG